MTDNSLHQTDNFPVSTPTAEMNIDAILASLLAPKKTEMPVKSEFPVVTPDQSPYFGPSMGQELAQMLAQLVPLAQTGQIPLVPQTLPDKRFNFNVKHESGGSMSGMDDFIIPQSEELDILTTPIDKLESPIQQSSKSSSSASLEMSIAVLTSFLTQASTTPLPGMKTGGVDEFIDSVAKEPRFSGDLANLLEPLRDANLLQPRGGEYWESTSPLSQVSPLSIQSSSENVTEELDDELMEQFEKL
jgi:hypothetical protein